MKRGFTIIEMLVVVVIVGVVVAALALSMGGATDSARASKCLSNLHTLAGTCNAVASSENYFPRAGSFEIKTRGSGRTVTYSEAHGWISWASVDAYRGSVTSPKASAGWFISTYETDETKRIHALTNGSLWRAVSGNTGVFVCPEHEKIAKKKGLRPVWSYVMNSYFVCDDTRGSGAKTRDSAQRYELLTRSDRRLLFAELPFNPENTSQTCSFSTGTGIALDPTLQYEENEVIGFNHKTKKKWYAHVAFADGHTETLEQPSDAGTSQLQELTTFLCEGKDITYNGSRYEEVTQ